jgi:hypothetical protein
MKKLLIMIVWSLIFLSGCVDKSTNLQEQYMANDSKVYKGSFHIRGKTVPLPPGEWKIMANGFDSDKFFQLYLVHEHPGKIFQSIWICVDSIELNREYGYSIADVAKRLDMHHVVTNKHIAGEPHDWWFVNNQSAGFNKKEGKPVLNEAIDYIKSHNLVTSNDYVFVRHRLTGSHPYKKRYLDVEYYYNPEVEGFPQGDKSEWRNSDWNATRVNEDPRKSGFIKELINKHNSIHQQLKAGFHPG